MIFNGHIPLNILRGFKPFIANVIKFEEITNRHILLNNLRVLKIYVANPTSFVGTSTLQSGIFTINKTFIIGLVSSIITAAIAYGVRFYVSKYLLYDIFSNLDNVPVSLTYFCSLGGIRFLIKEGINTLHTSCAGGPMPVSSSTAESDSLPRGSSAAGLTSSMQAPNNPGGSNFSADPSYTPGTIADSGTGTSNSSTENSNDLSNLEKKIFRVKGNAEYQQEQIIGWRQEIKDLEDNKNKYIEDGKLQDWEAKFISAHDALKDSHTNFNSEIRMYHILESKRVNGDYSMSGPSSNNKRKFGDSSIANDNPSISNNKRGNT